MFLSQILYLNTDLDTENIRYYILKELIKLTVGKVIFYWIQVVILIIFYANINHTLQVAANNIKENTSKKLKFLQLQPSSV